MLLNIEKLFNFMEDLCIYIYMRIACKHILKMVSCSYSGDCLISFFSPVTAADP